MLGRSAGRGGGIGQRGECCASISICAASKRGSGLERWSCREITVIAIGDVVVGEVWICGGQSNMNVEVAKATGGEDELALPPNPWLRQYDNGSWVVAGPKTVGPLKAVGYYFGKNLQQQLQRPVGLAIALQPATAIELWISPEAMDRDSELKAGNERVKELSRVFESYGPRYLEWESRYERKDRAFAPVETYAAPDRLRSTTGREFRCRPCFPPVSLPDVARFWIRQTITDPSKRASRQEP